MKPAQDTPELAYCGEDTVVAFFVDRYIIYSIDNNFLLHPSEGILSSQHPVCCI